MYLGRATERRRLNRRLNRANVDAYLSVHPCVDCGESDTDVLDFDHRDATQKLDEISRMLGPHVWEEVLEEIEKCDVRCGNCHRRRTAAQFGWVREDLSGYLV